MKFTSEDLMKAMGLNVGDRVKLDDCILEINKDFTVTNITTQFPFLTLNVLIGLDYEILPRPKRVGELMCDEEEMDCFRCPLKSICRFIAPYDDGDGMSLYKALKFHNEKYNIDQEIYDLLKSRLDKAVE